jgi:EmrB/QacA subfamily drug resistance transporter
METGNRKSILVILFIGVLMGALDIAIVGPALPAIRADLNISERALSWIFSLYVLFNLIGTPIMAKLSDIYGRRWIYVLDVSIFALGSLITALSPNITILLIGRAIQGFGAGGIFPVASAVIGDTFPPEKRGGALGLIGAVFGLAFLIGPILGGVILSFASWKWLFLINLPVALVVILMAMRSLPATRREHSQQFDWLGMIVIALLLTSLALSINQLDTQNFFSSLLSTKVLASLIAFLVLFSLMLWIESRVENPIIPLSLFSRRQLRLAYIFSAGAGFAEAGMVYLPLLAVVQLSSSGINNQNASWMLMPVVLAMAFGSPLSGRLLDKIGSRIVIISGTFITTLGMVGMGLFSNNLVLFILSGFLIGLGLSSLLGAPLRYISLNETASTERSTAQGVISITASTGQLLGGAMIGAIAASSAQSGDVAAGYSLAFLVMGLISLVMVGLAFLLKKRSFELASMHADEA